MEAEGEIGREVVWDGEAWRLDEAVDTGAVRGLWMSAPGDRLAVVELRFGTGVLMMGVRLEVEGGDIDRFGVL